jgi:hypothetical protein
MMKIDFGVVRYSITMSIIYGTSVIVAIYFVIIGSKYLATLTRELHQWVTLS